MKHKLMLGDAIYSLRKSKGLSQAELGKMVGVSNKAVSKWETDEANPDIQILPLLAKALDVSIDELLSEKNQGKIKQPKEGYAIGMKGTVINNPDKYEFISDRKTKKGTPYVHIHIGKNLSTLGVKAKGIIAIGFRAQGLISLGVISKGLLSFGLLSIGLLALGPLSIGLLAAIGAIAIGGVAVGGFAVGIVAVGGVAIGVVAVGGLAIGIYAHTGEPGGIAIGIHTFFHKNKY